MITTETATRKPEPSFLKTVLKGRTTRRDPSPSPALALPSVSYKVFDRKHSKSLTDLTNGRVTIELQFARGDDGSPKIGRSKTSLCRAPTSSADTEKMARKRIANLVLLNAWRRQRADRIEALDKINGLNKKIEGFEMQVYVLRQLLNAEKDRVKAANENVQALLQNAEKDNEDKSKILKKNEALEKNIRSLLQHCSQLEDTIKNQANDIFTSKLEAENWEKQLEKEREKLRKVQSEEIVLKDRIQESEKVIVANAEEMERLTDANQDLQLKLSFQVPLLDETMTQLELASARLKELEMVKEELQNVLEEREAVIRQLKSTIGDLEKKLQEEDEKNGLLGKAILVKTNELNEIHQQMGQLSRIQYPWSGGIVRMASLCAKIPVACICTVGSLLLPFPSYRF